MELRPIYTIGHGNRKIDDFIFLLKSFDVNYLVDVRSKPYSKYNPQFNQGELKQILELNKIVYVFMGDSIGGRPDDKTCYDEDGKVNYEFVKAKDIFKNCIERLKVAYNKSVPIIIMCSESNPCDCHRSKLIGRVLDKQKIPLKHIDEKDKIKTQADVINALNKGLSDTTLFPSEITINSTSRKSYI